LKKLHFEKSPTKNNKECNFKHFISYPRTSSTDLDETRRPKPPVVPPKLVVDSTGYDMVDNANYFLEAINHQLAQDKSVSGLSFSAKFLVTPTKNIAIVHWVKDLKRDKNKPLVEAALRNLRFEHSPTKNNKICYFNMTYNHPL
jgi:hypothetical protein